MEFVSNNKALSAAMKSGKQPNDKQMKMLMQFMVSDPFFQTQLINQISEQPNNDWLKDVSKDAQIRFLKIVASIPPSKL